MNPVHFSSKTDQHATPRDLAKQWVEEFGLTLDVCADASNAVVPRYFTKEQDGLAAAWHAPLDRIWCNPPYGREIGTWVWRCALHAQNGGLAVALLPARTDTRWFQSYVLPVLQGRQPGQVRFIAGRLKFGDAKNGAPFPSMLVVFGTP